MAGFENDEDRGPVYFVKLKTKAEDGFGFQVKKAKGNNETEDVGTFTKLKDMRLKKISWHVGEYQGNPVNSIRMQMVPNGTNDLYFVNMGLTTVSRGIMNKLFTINDFGNIEITTFKTDFENAKKEKVDIIASGMKANGVKLVGKYDFNEVFKPLIVIAEHPITHEKVKYFEKVDAKLREMVEADLVPAIKLYNDTVEGGLPASQSVNESPEKKSEFEKGPSAPEEDDLPF